MKAYAEDVPTIKKILEEQVPGRGSRLSYPEIEREYVLEPEITV